MKQEIKRTRNKIVSKSIGVDLLNLESELLGVSAKLADIEVALKEVASIRKELEAINEMVSRNNGLLKSQRDNISVLSRELRDIRGTAEYRKTFEDRNPLVTVRIASYNKTEQLMDVALKSVLSQTYKNLEIIIVNDGPNVKTKKAIEKLKDRRVKYIEFPHRSLYPTNPEHRWMVAGSPGMNEGASMSSGAWIAPLDDDDSFTEDHVEYLLGEAISGDYEMFYGSLDQVNTDTKEVYKVWSYPPTYGHFSFQGAIYMRILNFFMYDQKSWLVEEPGDWNLCRRMVEAGVRIGSKDKNVGTLYYTPVASK